MRSSCSNISSSKDSPGVLDSVCLSHSMTHIWRDSARVASFGVLFVLELVSWSNFRFLMYVLCFPFYSHFLFCTCVLPWSFSHQFWLMCCALWISVFALLTLLSPLRLCFALPGHRRLSIMGNTLFSTTASNVFWLQPMTEKAFLITFLNYLYTLYARVSW